MRPYTEDLQNEAMRNALDNATATGSMVWSSDIPEKTVEGSLSCFDGSLRISLVDFENPFETIEEAIECQPVFTLNAGGYDIQGFFQYIALLDDTMVFQMVQGSIAKV